MANQAVEQFIKKVNGSPELLAKCRDAIRGSEDATGFAALGRENGFAFTKEDAQAYFQEALGAGKPGELSDEELANIAGGKDTAPLATRGSIDLFRNMDLLTTAPLWTGLR